MAKAIPLPVVQTGFERSVEAGKKAVGTIRLPVDIDSSAFSKLNQPLGRITGLATEFEKSIAASNARVLAFGASVGILNGVANAFKSILTNGIAVEKALGEIGTISGQSAAQLDKLGDSLFDVAKNTSQSFGVAAKAALEFSRQGLSVEETVKRTNDALTLTRFTSLSAADAVDTLTAAVNSFAGSGITTTEILNKLIAVDTAFAVSAEDLANGLARAGSIAQEVGVSFDELNGLITVAQERTARGGSVIGNALKTIFTRIRGDDTISALRNIGVESLDAAGNLRDVVPVLTDLSNKLKDLGKGERIEILEAVASKYNINILSALLGDIGNAQGQFTKAVGTSLNAGNEATERQVELNKLLDSLLNKTAESAAQLANNLAKIGVTDSLKSLLGYVNSFLDSINKLLSSDDTGGNIARGIIKGFSDVLFTVGLPVIAAIFVKLTKDIATFGVESLQTILGINQKVKERQALEQAVTNTLISNKGIMDQILAASGNRVKQEQILLDAYNKQIQALSVIQSISASVAPTLQGAGLSAGSGGVTRKKAAGGYLPAQEAADVRRGVGGASSSSKVVSIPNFAFGGGKKGTMIANTSEYIVPNYANGGSAIFNQDMVKAYGLPAGAKKIGAAGGYVPNFAKYVYDSDRIPADKNATLKAILASSAKKNLLIAPAGAGKSTLAAGMGKFLTGAADVANATEIDILSGAGRTKDGGLSKNLESIMAAVNSSGGKVSYLYTKNFDILSRRAGRTDPSEGDLRSKKQLAGTAYAPLNQFDFMSMVKSRANSFGMVRGAGGYIPNFADVNEPERFAALIGKKSGGDSGFLNRYSLWASQDSQGKVQVSDIAKPTSGDEQNGKLIKFNAYGVPSKSDKQLTDVKQQLSEYGKNSAVQLAQNMTSQALPSDFVQGKLAATFNPGSLSSFAGTIFEASVGALLGDKSFKDYSEQAVTSAFDLDIRSNQNIKKDFKIPNDVDFLEVKGSDSPPLIKSIAKKIYQVTELNRAAVSKRKIGNTELKQLGMQRPLSDLDKLIVIENGKTNQFGSRKELEDYVSSKYTKNVGNSTVAGSPKFSENVWPSIGPRTKRGATGYIPNFAQGGPLEDAVQREMAAGLDPSQIRVTSDGKLKNSKNPNGLAVINTRDEPNGKVPNFAVRAPAGAVDAAGRKIGGRFITPANTVAATSENPAKQDAEERGLLTTNKLFGAFAVLTTVTGTLQNTVGKTNEGFGKLAAAATQVAAGASGGGLLGNLAQDAFGEKLSGLGAFGKGVAKNLPFIGALAGGAFEAYGAYQQNKQRERGIALAGANERVNEEVKTIQETSASPEEENQQLQKLAERKQLAFTNFGSDLTKAKARLSDVQKTRQQKSSNQAFGSKGYISDDEELALYNEEQALKEKVSVLTNTYKGGVQKTALEDEAKAAAEALRKSTESIANAATKRGKEEAKATEELRKRLPLEKAFYDLSLSISKNQAEDNINSARRYAESAVSASQLSSLAQEYNNFLIGRNQIQDKINNLEKDSLNTILKQLKSKATATVDDEALKSLIQRLKNGEDLAGVEKELRDLGLGSLETNKKAIQDQNLVTEGKKIEIRQEEQLYVLNKKTEISIKTQNSLLKDRLSIIENAINIEARRRSAAAERETEEEDYNRQLALRNLEDKVASKPFASSSDKAELLRARNSFALEQEKARLSKATAQLEQNVETKRLEFTSQLIKNETIFTAAQRERFALQLKTANEEKDKIKRQEMLLALTKDIASSEYEIEKRPTQTFDVDAEKFYDPNSGSVDVQGYMNAFNEFEKKRNEDTAVFEAGKTTRDSSLKTQLNNFNQEISQLTTDLETAKGTERKRINDLIRILSYEQKIADLRAKSPAQAGAVRAIDEITERASNFTETFSYNTTMGFRDGLRDALDAAVSGTDDLKGALQGVAQGFLRTMQQAFLQQASDNVMVGLSKALPSVFQMPKTAAKGGYIQKFAAGGMVTGGSGIRDDVPAMLSAGEYVMRKSAVQKYGAENIAKMNNGGIFLPGVRGGSAISGYDQLSKFANQTTTSGATDVLKGSGSTAFANLEDQSARLSRFGLMNEDTIKGEITSAQQQGLELMAQREAYRTQQRKAMQQQIVGTALALAINVGVGKLGSKGTDKVSAQGIKSSGVASMSSTKGIYDGAGPMSMGSFTSNIQSRLSPSKKAYGGMIRGFNNGGGPTDDIPALLMGGEYVMDRATVRKYGKQYLDSMNTGRARFAEGGYAGVEAETMTESSDSKAKVDSKTGTEVNIRINVSGSSSSTESQGQTSQGGVDYKKMGERIKAVVLETINEEKRLGGALRSR